MKRYATLATILLFAILTLAYFRYVIWSPPDALMTRHLATDLYGHYLHTQESTGLLEQGVIPLGDYWVQRGGGYPAALNDQLLLPFDLLLMATYAVTDSFPLALKAAVIPLYFAILPLAYWYGTIILKRRDASVVLAVAYTFSLYGINQLEHPELLVVQPFILLTLIFLEKALASPDRLKYVVLTSLGLLSVWLSQPYPFYFLLIFIAFRFVFQLTATQPRMKVLKCAAKVGVLSVLAIVPFALIQLSKAPPEVFVEGHLRLGLDVYSQPPTLYFLRNTTFLPHLPEIYYMYVGVSVLALALVPMIVGRAKGGLYLFYLLITAFFFLYAVGQYGPVNLALWFSEHLPLAYFIRVPGRALVLGYLGLSVCAAIGFGVLVDKLGTSRPRWIPLIVLLTASVIFADLTIGYEPHTMTVPSRPEGAYEFLKSQPDDFRILEIPAVNGQQVTTAMSTKRDTLTTTIWAFGHFEPLWTFADVYREYVARSGTAQGAALYGVKYVVVNTDPKYFDTFSDALRVEGGPNLEQLRQVDEWLSESSDHLLVYGAPQGSGRVKIYENLKYRGLVFSDGTDSLTWLRKDSNTLVMTYYSTKPTSITISQSFAEGWTATLDGEKKLPVRNHDSVQQVDVPPGDHSIVLHYDNYERWFLVLIGCYIALATIIVWLKWRRSISKRRLERCNHSERCRGQ